MRPGTAADHLLELSRQRSLHLSENRAAAANRIFDRLEAGRIKRRGELSAEEFEAEIRALMARSSDADTRVLFAAWLLPFDELSAIETLQRIADDQTAGLAGLDAKMTIREWRAGRILR